MVTAKRADPTDWARYAPAMTNMASAASLLQVELTSLVGDRAPTPCTTIRTPDATGRAYQGQLGVTNAVRMGHITWEEPVSVSHSGMRLQTRCH